MKIKYDLTILGAMVGMFLAGVMTGYFSKPFDFSLLFG
jgi:hypothetical protein